MKKISLVDLTIYIVGIAFVYAAEGHSHEIL